MIYIDPNAVTLMPLDLDPATFQSSLPDQHYHLLFADAAIGLAVGIWDTTTMQEAFGPYPGDEFVTILDGRFAIVDGTGHAVTGGPGQSACIQNGIPVSWTQDGYLRKIYLTLQRPDCEPLALASADGGVIVLDPAGAKYASHASPGHAGLGHAGLGAADEQLHGSRSRQVLFRNDLGTLCVTECQWPEVETPVCKSPAHQLLRVLSGQITLTDPHGVSTTCGPDSHVFLPGGTLCKWLIADGTVAWHVEVSPA